MNFNPRLQFNWKKDAYRDILSFMPCVLIHLIAIYLGLEPCPGKRNRVWKRKESERLEQWEKHRTIRVCANTMEEVGRQIRRVHGDIEPDWASMIRPCFLDVLEWERVGHLSTMWWEYDASEEEGKVEWALFNTHIQYILTKMIQRKSTCGQPSEPWVDFIDSKHRRRINLLSMSQTNLETGRQRKIRMTKMMPVVPVMRDLLIKLGTCKAMSKRMEHMTITQDLGYTQGASRRDEDPEMQGIRDEFLSRMRTEKGYAEVTSLARLHNAKSFNLFRAQLESFTNKNVVLVWWPHGVLEWRTKSMG